MPAGRITDIIRSRPTCRVPNTFIPPQAERIQQRPRMPRIEDLPMPAQRQILQKRGELGDDHQPDQQRKGLFQRIASGLTGRDSEPVHEPAPAIRPIPRRATAKTTVKTTVMACRSGRPRVRWRSASRCRMPGPGPRRASTRMAGRPLCIIRGRTINWKSRPSCAARPIKAEGFLATQIPAPARKGRGFLLVRAGRDRSQFIEIVNLFVQAARICEGLARWPKPPILPRVCCVTVPKSGRKGTPLRLLQGNTR